MYNDFFSCSFSVSSSVTCSTVGGESSPHTAASRGPRRRGGERIPSRLAASLWGWWGGNYACNMHSIQPPVPHHECAIICEIHYEAASCWSNCLAGNITDSVSVELLSFILGGRRERGVKLWRNWNVTSKLSLLSSRSEVHGANPRSGSYKAANHQDVFQKYLLDAVCFLEGLISSYIKLCPSFINYRLYSRQLHEASYEHHVHEPLEGVHRCFE